jgi:hypothetical protein
MDRDCRAHVEPVGDLGGGDAAARAAMQVVAHRRHGDVHFIANHGLTGRDRIHPRLQRA